MNLENLKNKLKPKLVPFAIEDETIYIHRPTLNDINSCDTIQKTVLYCAKDENGDPIFSLEDIESRININAMDSTLITKIYTGISDLFKEADPVDEVEKK